MASTPPTRDELLAAELRALPDVHVELRCDGCTRIVVTPLQLAATRHPRVKLGDWLRRLKCQCGGRVSQAIAGDHPILDAAHTVGTVASWSVVLLP